MGEIDGGERLGQRADLIDLDENGVARPFPDAALEPRDIGDEKIVSDKLAFGADLLRQQPPAIPIIFGHAVLDRNDRIVRDEFRKIRGLCFG